MRGEVTRSMNQGNASAQDETVVGETEEDAPVGLGSADLISRTARYVESKWGQVLNRADRTEL